MDTSQIEHRRTRRVRMKQALRVRPADPKDQAFEEVGTTKNVSQGGVYFVTERENYYEGMHLRVMLPYSTTGAQNYEYHGEITRIDQLPDNQKGIAIRFVSSASKKTPKS